MKIILIDDELQARKLLSHLLQHHVPEAEILAECEDLSNGVKAIRKHKPDLVFLDIEMPGHSGLELMEFFTLEEVDFGVIFITAYSQYAIRAFKLNAFDYLLKPVDTQELVDAVNRFKVRRPSREQFAELKASTERQTFTRIAVPVGQALTFIELDNILFLKAENSYTEINFRDKTKLLVSRTLKNFEDTLQDFPEFIRSHKSYIVNKKYITNYVKSDGGYLELSDQSRIPINHDAAEQLVQNMTVVRR